MKHKHHIIPKHMGGSDDPENLIELTIEEHADAHRILFEKYGKIEDYWAWKGLSGQIGKEELLREISKNNGKKVYENKLGIFAMSKEERLPFIKKGGKTSGKKNAESGNCAEIAHLGGKSASGMTFWYNSKTNEETKSFESPGQDWEPGVNMERVNIEQLRKQANNRKNSFWIHNPETVESKMIFTEEEIPNGFIEGRKIEIKNTIIL
jgi:CRISPR/Cas system CMR subunit Cmr4 (Cas7 group RAMP superfamily)